MRSEVDEVLERLEALFANARPVPLTDQVRVDLREVQMLLQELREQSAADGSPRPVAGGGPRPVKNGCAG